MSLAWNENKYRGKVVTQEAVETSSPMDLKNRIFLDMTAVAPSPSRDYFRLKVTNDSVKLMQWKISHGRARSTPIEMEVALEDFSKDLIIPSEILRVFGKHFVQYIERLSEGRYDWILFLPKTILVKIVAYVGIENLSIVAPVCETFREICHSNGLWDSFYRRFSLVAKDDATLRFQTNYVSWRTLFLVNRIQDLAFPRERLNLGTNDPKRSVEVSLKTAKLVNDNGDGDAAFGRIKARLEKYRPPSLPDISETNETLLDDTETDSPVSMNSTKPTVENKNLKPAAVYRSYLPPISDTRPPVTNRRYIRK